MLVEVLRKLHFRETMGQTLSKVKSPKLNSAQVKPTLPQLFMAWSANHYLLRSDQKNKTLNADHEANLQVKLHPQYCSKF